MIGKTLSHFRILEKIGEGGMGIVYRAEDTRLRRHVALKLLPPELVANEERRRRFLREARAAAAVNHPNIATIHEVDEAEGVVFIAMELVEGKTLRELISRRPLPVREALRLSLEIAEGLARAHQARVIHRDLKPDNVAVGPDGHAKILDFGLAKLLEEEARGAGSVSSQLETRSTGITGEPRIVGTVAYMSPEQARGGPVDARSDIFSFGVTMYEMLTGRAPFRGSSDIETLSAILREEPEPPGIINPELPQELARIIGKCLRKEPQDRYQHADDIAVDLRDLRRAMESAPQAASAGAVQRRRPPRKRARISSVAVLPLANLSRDPEQDYFTDGMTEALISDLARLRALKVISRTSAMRYKATDKSLPEIAEELNVDAVVEGSVLRVGQRVRITAQLIHAATDTHLWAQSYERDLHDVLLMQSEVARAIAREIQVTVTPEETRRLAGARQVNPEAYEAYLKGRFHWNRLSPEHLKIALAYFQLALDKDPNYALAHGAIADTWGARAYLGLVPPREAFPKSKAGVLKALELDDTLAEAHDLLGRLTFYYEWNWSGAGQAFQRAIELNPNYADVRSMYWDFLMSMKRPQEARAQIERCLELDPLNFYSQSRFGQHLLYLRRYDDALAQFRKTLRTEPNLPPTHEGLWAVFHQKGMYEEALAEAKEFFAVLGHSEVAESLTHGSSEAGYPRAMSLAAETLVARLKRAYVQPTQIARLYAYAGEKDRALEWLEKAYDERDMLMVNLSVSLHWDSLRSEPRFQDLLQRMNLPK